MKYVVNMIILMNFINPIIIFDFNKDSDIQNWRIVDDIVMGGRSSGQFTLNSDGFGVFSGDVSLENNGGFSSVRYSSQKISVQKDAKIRIKLKGDGKNYQLRVKDNARNYYSYVKMFSTSGEWEEIIVSLKDMYPTFRGRRLNSPNFEKDVIEEIAILIGNKKNEAFELIIDTIVLN